jgi:hypothetical protein
MYTFAVILLLGLAVMAVIMIFERFVRIADEIVAAVAILLGIGTAWLADFNLFAEWGLVVREEWIGLLLTGVVLGGVAYLFHEVVGILAGMHRKYVDEVVEFEKAHDLRRVA